MEDGGAGLMTVEDVAAYLRVAERTIYDWAQRGSIPCGKLGASWRFRRTDIDQWLEQKFHRKPPTKKPGGEVMLTELLCPERIVIFDAHEDKKQVLERLCAAIGKSGLIGNPRELREGIFRREELMSTGIGLGLAVPHVRLDSIKDIAVAVGICREPVAGYEALDGKPVRLVFMIAAATGQHARHIRLLAQIASRMKDAELRETLLVATSADEVMLILGGE